MSSLPANGGGDLYVYLQVLARRRVRAGRNHARFQTSSQTVFAFCAAAPRGAPELHLHGLACITAQDTRWARCDHQVGWPLLANVLLRQQAVEAGAAETILLRDGWLTDASASAVHMVVAGEIRTPPRSHLLLPGTTPRTHRGPRWLRTAFPAASVAVSEAALRGADEVWPECGDARRGAGDAHRRPEHRGRPARTAVAPYERAGRSELGAASGAVDRPGSVCTQGIAAAWPARPALAAAVASSLRRSSGQTCSRLH